MWSFIEAVIQLLDLLSNWRFSVCLIAGIVLAIAVASGISAEPARWIVAGIIVVASIIIGWRWESAN